MEERSADPSPTRGARLSGVDPGSRAEKAGLRAGDAVLRVDGEEMRDLIDLYLLLADDVPHELEVVRDGERLSLTLPVGRGEPGMEVAEPVFDGVRLCRNDCIFCFVDQLPEGLKPSVYVKDDDYRLSFLQGNFVTLTNLSDDDMRRISDEMLSPLYVSLHTTDPELRARMFGSPRAASALKRLKELLDAGIQVHVQLVLLRGVNDADSLDRTLRDLAGYYSPVSSVGAVPIGITGGGRISVPREWGFDRDSARETIEQLDSWRGTFGDAGPFASDEFFFMAGLDAPPAQYYSDFAQTENGIGLARLFRDNFTESAWRLLLPEGLASTAVVTTPIGAWALSGLGLDCTGARLLVCINTLFGPGVNVCGLLPGRDILRELERAREPGGRNGIRQALVPAVAVDDNGDFIDGMSVEELAEESGARITVVPVAGSGLVRALWEAREEGSRR